MNLVEKTWVKKIPLTLSGLMVLGTTSMAITYIVTSVTRLLDFLKFLASKFPAIVAQLLH